MKFMMATTRSREKGAATLGLTVLLLLVISLMGFYANKSIWLEQQAATNQYFGKKALEAAEAGIEYAINVLNNASTTSPTRSDYLNFISDSKFEITNNQIDSSTLSGFDFEVKILEPSISHPCTQDTPQISCFKLTSEGRFNCSNGKCGGVAKLSVLIRSTPFLSNPPSDAASVYGELDFNGQGEIKNVTTTGYAFRTKDTTPTFGPGTTVTSSTTTGTCGSGAGSCNDFSTISDFDDFSKYFFGTDFASLKYGAPSDSRVDCSTATNAELLAASNTGLILCSGNVSINKISSSVGSPVILIAEGDVNVNDDFYGFMFTKGDISISGNKTIKGAMASFGDLTINGGPTMSVEMDPSVLNSLKAPASINRVLGSWKDWE